MRQTCILSHMLFMRTCLNQQVDNLMCSHSFIRAKYMTLKFETNVASMDYWIYKQILCLQQLSTVVDHRESHLL